MSEINQAFLRAYVKSRTASSLAQATTHASSSQPLAAPQEDVQRRVDLPAAPPVPAKTTPEKTGVWSALGVERGMKGAVRSQSPPAVVRNATNAVPLETTQPRSKPTVQSPSLESLNQAWTKRRAPALSELKARTPEPAPVGTRHPLPPTAPASPAPASPAPASPAPGMASRGKVEVPAEHSAARIQIRIDRPITAAPSIPTDEETLRADAASSHRMPAPHSIPDSQRRAERESERGIGKEQLQKLPLPVAFAPSWEVDSFTWPEVVIRLEQTDPANFRRIGHHLANANQSGLKVLAVTSGERGVGRSTVAMHAARAAACAGLRVALVDTDAANPSLVDQLRLDVQNGWQDCLFEAVPLEEVAVHAASDQITFFPLTDAVAPQQVQANLHRMSKLIRRISTAFDLVVLDAGRLHLDQRSLIGVSSECVVDAAVVVVDTELSIKDKVDSAISILQSLGLSSIGLVENFRS